MNHVQSSTLDPSDLFIHRHIGPSPEDISEMLAVVGCRTLDELTEETVPAEIRMKNPLALGPARGEHELLGELARIAAKNEVFHSLIGMGYYDCITPPVILRNILENPGWYTQYTPYQAEISQGRLEALLNFQTMVSDLTALPVANASLLDEATAAAEAMSMALHLSKAGDSVRRFFVAEDCHPQTIAVVRTRAMGLGVEVVVGPAKVLQSRMAECFGILVQYPATDGRIESFDELAKRAHQAGALVIAATDLLALTLLRPPGEWGADIAIGSAQRFGVSLGFGGPHAAFMSCRDEYKRQMPGRIAGVSKDAQGLPAFRLSIQTREQHIRREKATSNICTAQVLLAIMAGMYAVYHGPAGLRRIALRVRAYTTALRAALKKLGHEVGAEPVFDTIRVRPVKVSTKDVLANASSRRINLRDFGDGTLGISLDETTDRCIVQAVIAAFGGAGKEDVDSPAAEMSEYPSGLSRESGYLTHPVFNTHHSETQMLRYIFKLQSRDLSLAHAMIPLGSCTMKLNGTSEMIPVTWPSFAAIHPFAPAEQTRGYTELFRQLETWLAEITGFAAVSLQPNAGSQGEYAGLMVIRAYHESRGEAHRDVCLIPESA
ncbi:MAG TPA: glycine dehydrogenase (aminomethyl-transferring), partial [Phycisphaerae bacterium]|nr:glycine dehydrogenase (aminomethyl-transferring) [Phycisphaerae bacterium]